MLNANPDHMLRQRGGLDLRTKRAQSIEEVSHESNPARTDADEFWRIDFLVRCGLYTLKCNIKDLQAQNQGVKTLGL